MFEKYFGKPIVIQHKKIHPLLKDKIEDVLDERGWRAGLSLFQSGIFGDVAMSRVGSRASIVFTGASLPAMWKLGSISVRKKTSIAARRAEALPSVDAEGKFSPVDLAKTHPIVKIDRKGNLHFLPATWFQQVLYKGQRHWLLRELIPGRYREMLTAPERLAKPLKPRKA